MSDLFYYWSSERIGNSNYGKYLDELETSRRLEEGQLTKSLFGQKAHFLGSCAHWARNDVVDSNLDSYIQGPPSQNVFFIFKILSRQK